MLDLLWVFNDEFDEILLCNRVNFYFIMLFVCV